jgi:hypothetical protein
VVQLSYVLQEGQKKKKEEKKAHIRCMPEKWFETQDHRLPSPTAVRLSVFCVLFVSSSHTYQATHKEGRLPAATSQKYIQVGRREREKDEEKRSAQVELEDISFLTKRRFSHLSFCSFQGHERLSSNALVLVGWFRNEMGRRIGGQLGDKVERREKKESKRAEARRRRERRGDGEMEKKRLKTATATRDLFVSWPQEMETRSFKTETGRGR